MAEAELLRDAVHLVALTERRWQEPLFRPTCTAAHGDSAGLYGLRPWHR